MEKFFVSSDFLKNLIEGSYEDKIIKLNILIQKNKLKFVEDNNILIKPIATFEDYVIVCSSDGRFWKVRVMQEKDDYKMGDIEKLDVPLLSSEEVLNNYIDNIVNNIIEGKSVEFDTDILKIILGC